MGHGASVLIVDDDPVIRQLMRSLLQSQGCDVSVATTGTEAIRQAEALLPDIILLDVVLPDIDGLTVCHHIRGVPVLAEVPIIMITSLNDPDARVRSLEMGADDFIAKPIDFLELRARVGSILRLNRYRRLLHERTHRQRAEEETVRRNRELSLLNGFIVSTTASISADRHIEVALQEASRVLCEALELPLAEAWLLNEAGDTVLASATYDASPDGAPAAPVQAARARALTPADVRAPWALDDVSDTALAPEAAAWLRARGGEAALLAPIMVNGVVSGALALVSPARRTFDGRARAFAQSLAGALAQTLEAALLHQQLQRQLDQLEDMVALRTRELRAERDRTQAILEAMGEGLIVTDSECLIRYANPAMLELTGYRSEDLLGSHWCDMQRDEQSVALYHSIRDQVTAGRVWRGEVTGSGRGGSTYEAAMTVAPIFGPDQPGVPTGIVSIQRDIGPLKAAERMKDQFVSNVSHELRTPLSVIALHSGNLDTLYDRLGDDRRRRLIREIRAQADLLDDLIGDVLELNRIDGGQLAGAYALFDLAELLRLEADHLRPLADGSALSMQVCAHGPLVVRGDEAQLRQVIRNLIGNAIKYTRKGGSLTCEVRRMDGGPLVAAEWPGYPEIESGNWVGVRVVDTGIGIAAEHITRVFERFYRVQSQTDVPGTGLGLAIARELVTRQGGWIGAASTPGVGSTFAFYIPLASGA